MAGATDERRAREPGRGRRVDAPLQLGWTGWKDTFFRAAGKVGTDRVLLVAAGVTVFFLFASI